jgi:hypothetical protein
MIDKTKPKWWLKKWKKMSTTKKKKLMDKHKMLFMQGLMQYGVGCDEKTDPDQFVFSKLAYWVLVNRFIQEKNLLDDFLDYEEYSHEDSENTEMLKGMKDDQRIYTVFTAFLGGQEEWTDYMKAELDTAGNIAAQMIKDGAVIKIDPGNINN